jgi:AcrR family transcriptional regulator
MRLRRASEHRTNPTEPTSEARTRPPGPLTVRRFSSYCLTMTSRPDPEPVSVEARVLEAAKACCARWGVAKVTIDDIAAEARVSRATLYRLFPGGKDVLFEAMRVRELEDFFIRLRHAVDGADTLEDLLVEAVVFSINDLRADEHLAAMLASEPGETASQLTVEGLPRIIRVATVFLTPLVEPHLGRAAAGEVVELLVRLVISYFLAPSERIDLADPAATRRFVTKIFLPAYATASTDQNEVLT